MKTCYLDVTYRRGLPFAAYLSLPRHAGERGARVERRGTAFLVDWSADGRPIGIEMPSPSLVTVEALNALLAELGLDPVSSEELAPLGTA